MEKHTGTEMGEKCIKIYVGKPEQKIWLRLR